MSARQLSEAAKAAADQEADQLLPASRLPEDDEVEPPSKKPHPNSVICGLPIKYLVCLLLIAQNTGVVLVLRYTRTVAGPKFLTSTAVLMQELIKIPCSLALLVVEKHGYAGAMQTVRRSAVGGGVRARRGPRCRSVGRCHRAVERPRGCTCAR